MKQTFKILSIICAALLGLLVGAAIDDSILEGYKSTGDLITAKDTYELKKVTPLAFALVFGYVVLT